MTPQEVISADAERNGKRPGAALHGVAIAMDKRKAKLLHDNKTVVILDPIDAKAGEYDVHLFTVDTPQGLATSGMKLVQQAKNTPELRKAYFSSTSSQIARLLRMAGVQLTKADKKGFAWMAEI